MPEGVKDSVCLEAAGIVAGARNESYGHPADDFRLVGRLWAAALGRPSAIEPETVGLMMVLLKVARELRKPKRDNRVDIAGYAETLEMIAQREAADAAHG